MRPELPHYFPDHRKSVELGLDRFVHYKILEGFLETIPQMDTPLIAEIGMEGGGVTIFGKMSEGAWLIWTEGNSIDLDETDDDIGRSWSLGPVNTLTSCCLVTGSFCPVQIHPDFLERFLAAFEKARGTHPIMRVDIRVGIGMSDGWKCSACLVDRSWHKASRRGAATVRWTERRRVEVRRRRTDESNGACGPWGCEDEAFSLFPILLTHVRSGDWGVSRFLRGRNIIGRSGRTG